MEWVKGLHATVEIPRLVFSDKTGQWCRLPFLAINAGAPIMAVRDALRTPVAWRT